MSLWELFAIAVGLSMDAFAVSICKGLSVNQVKAKHSLTCGVYFGGFQAMMPLIGYLLGVIGGNMIKEALSKEEEECGCDGCGSSDFGPAAMFPMAVATSIDALAVGVSFAFLKVDIVPAVSFIGVITFVLSAIGVKVGNVFGMKYKSKAELFGGIVLILMGCKILLEHLGILL